MENHSLDSQCGSSHYSVQAGLPTLPDAKAPRPGA